MLQTPLPPRRVPFLRLFLLARGYGTRFPLGGNGTPDQASARAFRFVFFLPGKYLFFGIFFTRCRRRFGLFLSPFPFAIHDSSSDPLDILSSLCSFASFLFLVFFLSPPLKWKLLYPPPTVPQTREVAGRRPWSQFPFLVFN